MNQDAPTTSTEQVPERARPSRFSPRNLAADHPLLMRAGIITFVVGMVNAILFGVLTNVFTQEAALLDNFRRVGLGIMLVGMSLVLWCFPTARKWMMQPVVAWNKINRILPPAGHLIALYCAAVVVMIPLALLLAYCHEFEWLIFLGLPYACMLVVWCIWGPGGSRAFFVGVSLTALVLMTPLGFDIGRNFGWYGYGEMEAAIWLSCALIGSIVCGFAGLLAYWIAKKLAAESKST